jgi:mitochondrial fission protein ELM1
MQNPIDSKPLILWLLGDGKPGHENQSLGLADAIARQAHCEVHRISIAGKRGLLTRIQAAVLASAGLPQPDLIIAAGHATHPALLWLARKHRAKSIVLMRPSLPLAWFDLCIAPTHDFPAAGRVRKNVIVTQGALNRVAPPDGGERSGGLILIGGPSGNHSWDGETLMAALTQITATGDWLLTDSRRTPAGFLDQIRQSLPAIEIFPHQQTSSNWLPEKLATAAEVWVTEDSVSMIYEALSSGAKVGLLPAPRNHRHSRVLRGLEQLVAEDFLTPFTDWQTSRQLVKPPSILREADRCAELAIRILSL